jgi:hypothetical protein|tara:strand:+ start:582 stop:881 length:300 start_codon:yes stop_codon:yes gene_type:complete
MIQIEDIIFQLYTDVVNIRIDGDVYTCTDKDGKPVTVDMTAVNTEFTKQNYKNERNYGEIGEQLDLLWHSIDADTELKTKFAGFYNAIKAVKDANPKPS